MQKAHMATADLVADIARPALVEVFLLETVEGLEKHMFTRRRRIVPIYLNGLLVGSGLTELLLLDLRGVVSAPAGR